MKIALTTPNYWPYVRRGTARYINILSKHLIEKGHQVTIITAKPGKGKVVRKDGLVIHYLPYLQHPLLLNYIDRHKAFPVSALWPFFKGNYDVVNCLLHPEGFAAHLVNKLKELRFVQNINSVPFNNYWGDSQIHKYMFRKSIYSANGLLFPSGFAARHMQEEYGVNGKVIPMPVDAAFFAGKGSKVMRNPAVLFVSDLVDKRKGLHVLLEAFYLFKKKVKGAVLQLAGHADLYTIKCISDGIPRDMKESVHIMGQGRLDDLPALYANAAMTVLPSIQEVFGMVLIESLASGTPVVGCNSGAIPEIITSPTVGSLFEGDPEGDAATNVTGLYEAMMTVFEIAQKRETSDACRTYARRYHSSIVCEEIEKLLCSVVTGAA